MLSENKIAALYVTATRHVRLRRNQKPTFTGWPGSDSGSGSGGDGGGAGSKDRTASSRLLVSRPIIKWVLSGLAVSGCPPQQEPARQEGARGQRLHREPNRMLCRS